MEDPLDLVDGHVAGRVEDGVGSAALLESAGGMEPAEGAGKLEAIQREPVRRVEEEAGRQRGHQRLRTVELERRAAGLERAPVAVVRERDELGREVLEAPVDPDLAPLELQDSLLHEHRPDLDLDAPLGRAGEAGRQVPGPVGQLRQHDARAQGADLSQPELVSLERQAAADGDFLSGHQRAGKTRVVGDSHVRQAHRRRKHAQLHGLKRHFAAERFLKSLLGDPLDQVLEPLRLPNRVRGRDHKHHDDPEEPQRRQVMLLDPVVRRRGRRRCLAHAFALAGC